MWAGQRHRNPTPQQTPTIQNQQPQTRLKRVSVSQGLMLESLSPRLLEPGGPHHNCPDKAPRARLEALAAAGLAAAPFTTGLLVGIGETRRERLEALVAIRRAHGMFGHVQEVIVQNFRRGKGGGVEGVFWSM